MRNMKFVLAITTITTLAGCMSGAAIKEATVVDPLVGKRLVSSSGNVFLIKPDGTMGGKIRGEDVVGTYTASSTETCSVYTAPAFLVGKEYCSVPAIDGDTVVFNRRDGTKSAVYKIEG